MAVIPDKALVDRLNSFIGARGEEAAAQKVESCHWLLGILKKRCESPIELLLGLHISQIEESFGGAPLRWSPSWPTLPIAAGDSRAGIYWTAQAQIGRYRADFLFEIAASQKSQYLIVECDGHDFHERTKEQAAADRSRDRAMLERGIIVLRFTGSEIFKDPPKCAQQIEHMLYRLEFGEFTVQQNHG